MYFFFQNTANYKTRNKTNSEAAQSQVFIYIWTNHVHPFIALRNALLLSVSTLPSPSITCSEGRRLGTAATCTLPYCSWVPCLHLLVMGKGKHLNTHGHTYRRCLNSRRRWAALENWSAWCVMWPDFLNEKAGNYIFAKSLSLSYFHMDEVFVILQLISVQCRTQIMKYKLLYCFVFQL